MKLNKFAATAALAIAAVGIASGTANAAPAAAPSTSVNYTAGQEGNSSVIKTDSGTLSIENGIFQIKAAAGNLVAGTPLQYQIDDFLFPIDAKVDGNKATLTPSLDLNRATYHPVALPFQEGAPWKTPYDREQSAFNRMKDQISLGATIGSAGGAIGGAVVGCGLGLAVGLVATAPLATLFGAGPLGGCIAGAAAVGFLGTLAGTLFVTIPVAVASAIQYFVTINEPFKAPPK